MARQSGPSRPSPRRTGPARPGASRGRRSPARPSSTSTGAAVRGATEARGARGVVDGGPTGRRPRPTPRQPARPPRRSRPRLTSRAAVLLILVAVLAVSYASSLRAYLDQRSHLDDVQARIADSRAAIEALEREKERLDDPAYVEQQARERLNYVMPGEKPFVVLRDGEPIEVESRLTDPSTIDPQQPSPWWDDAWDSMLVAGDPPRRTDPLPRERISDPEGAPTDDDAADAD
ncbi:hypothetical protein GCM10023340_36990 [Nocardioides marinquilinus]|uniref:Septum formation initiator family protein n=1 Tax=Nocardioides marinquilinus TaxID=1210400 RepID=A0ABP9PYJ6_9ACTN